jgi:hypothetical protein
MDCFGLVNLAAIVTFAFWKYNDGLTGKTGHEVLHFQPANYASNARFCHDNYEIE